ncbi:MAG: carboxypeptidase-like regulatory domain-containing protein [Burkholderiales bacterium]
MHPIYPVFWYSTEFRGRVVDAKTGQPIPDAVVLATWQLVGSFVENYRIKKIAVEEVLTDVQGTFRIPSWGPRFYFLPGRILNEQPHITILKKDYLPLTLDNHPKAMGDNGYGMNAEAIIRFDWQDEDLKMAPRGEDIAAYELAMNDIWSLRVGDLFTDKRCDWQYAPLSLVFLHNVKKELASYQRGNNLRYIFEIGIFPHCGNLRPEAFLKGH